MIDLLAYSCSALTLSAAASKIVNGRGAPTSTSRRYLVAAMVAFALAVAVTSPASLRAAAWAAPAHDGVRLLGNALAMTASFCLVGVHNYATARAAARRRTAIAAAALAGCVTAMTVQLAAAGTGCAPEFAAACGRDPHVVAYLAIYLSYISWGLAVFARLVLRYARSRDTDPLLRSGFRVVLAAAAVSLAWVAWKAAGIAVLAATGRPLPHQAETAEALAVIAVGTGAAGATVTAWWPAVRNVPVRWKVRRAARRLAPLWERVVEEVPQVRLDEPDESRMTRVERAEYRLYRRTLEIRDAQLALRPYVPPGIRAWAMATAENRCLDPVSRDVLVEAAELGAALDAHRAGQRHHPGDAEVVVVQHSSATPDLLAEARWLIRVGSALHSDPDIAALRRATGENGPAGAAPLTGPSTASHVAELPHRGD